jgi:uncharacterized protein (DUF2345 family)
MKLIAASGKITIQAQNDNVEVTAAKKMILTSLEQINLRAPKITYIAQGAQVTLANGAITTQCTGVHVRRAGKHVLTGAAGAELTFPAMPFSSSTEQEICSHVFDIGSMLHNDPNLEGASYQIWTKGRSPQLLQEGVINSIGRSIRVFTQEPKGLEFIVGENEWLSVQDDEPRDWDERNLGEWA